MMLFDEIEKASRIHKENTKWVQRFKAIMRSAQKPNLSD